VPSTLLLVVSGCQPWTSVGGVNHTRSMCQRLSAHGNLTAACQRSARHSELHWLDVPPRFNYKLGVITYGCQHGEARQNLVDYCMPVSDVPARQRLRSASRATIPAQHIRPTGFFSCRPSVWVGEMSPGIIQVGLFTNTEPACGIHLMGGRYAVWQTKDPLKSAMATSTPSFTPILGGLK